MPINRSHPNHRFFAHILIAASLLLSVRFALPDPSAAASDIGKNVGREVSSWAKALLFGAAALVGIPAICKRDLSGGLVIGLLLLVVGGFVYAPGSVKAAIDGVWQAVGR